MIAPLRKKHLLIWCILTPLLIILIILAVIWRPNQNHFRIYSEKETHFLPDSNNE